MCDHLKIIVRHKLDDQWGNIGQSAFLVPEKDINALAERIEYLIDHPQIWPGMGREGRKFVEENFDIKKLNQKLMNIYQGVIKNGC